MATVTWRTETAAKREERFFLIMACAMSAVIVAGFATNLAMGRSTFAVPVVYHLHAFVFFGWIALYLTQNWLVARGNVALHRRLGWLAAVWVPLMIGMGLALIVTSLRRSGGPFFFDQNEFLFSNALMLLLFGLLVGAAIAKRRRTDWHRRLMLVAMAILTGPGFGRLLPMPLLIPHAWHVNVAVSLLWPVVGMIADRRRTGSVHPAWFYGIGAVIGVQIAADLVAYSSWGASLTQDLVAGTPGAQRPMQAFLPQ